jgi:predicted DNA-binding transcriptional regulator AlpA
MALVGIKFQRLRDTRKQLGDLSSSAFYREMEDGTIPRPIKFGERTAVHPVHEIEAVMGARMNGATSDQLRALVAGLMQKRKDYLPEELRANSMTMSADDDAS